jgi:hypothetical protein
MDLLVMLTQLRLERKLLVTLQTNMGSFLIVKLDHVLSASLDPTEGFHAEIPETGNALLQVLVFHVTHDIPLVVSNLSATMIANENYVWLGIVHNSVIR